MTITAIHADEAEQAVLGGLLLNNDAVDQLGNLKAEHFFAQLHHQIFCQVLDIVAKGGAADAVTIFDRMGGRDVETLQYLNALTRNTPSAANIGHHARIVRDRALRRGVLALSSDLTERAHDSIGTPAGELIDHAQAELERLSAAKTKSEPRHASEGLRTFLDDLMSQEAGTGPKPLSTGFPDLDRKMSGGMRRGELIVIAARPKMGKTALALNIATNVAHENHSLFLSMEMPEVQVHQRAVASLGRLPLGYLLNVNTIPQESNANSDAWARITVGVEAERDLNLFIDDQGALSLLDVRTKARQVKRKAGLDLLVIDYLQLMAGEGNNRNAEIEGITRGLKALAKELDIAIILLSQLNRKLEERPNKRPLPSDLRDSGAIEQDCDVALFIYRDEIYNPDSPERGTAEVNVGLIRQGEPGKVRLAYVGEQTRFESLAPGWSVPEHGETSEPRGKSRRFDG